MRAASASVYTADGMVDLKRLVKMLASTPDQDSDPLEPLLTELRDIRATSLDQTTRLQKAEAGIAEANSRLKQFREHVVYQNQAIAMLLRAMAIEPPPLPTPGA